jgi:hypothetical protein
MQLENLPHKEKIYIFIHHVILSQVNKSPFLFINSWVYFNNIISNYKAIIWHKR